MADTRDTRRFIPDPPPADQDPELMEWLMRQFERIAEAAGQGETAQSDHEARTDNPHNTLPPWKTDPTYGDLYPDGSGSMGDAGIGGLDHPVAHVALGTQDLGGMEGFVADRRDTDSGGIVIMGLREVDPQNPPAPPLVANAPVEIAGSSILLMNGTVYLEVSEPITADTYLIVQPSVTHPDGRELAPITKGPEVVYQHEEDATDTGDYDVLDSGEVEIVSLTLANAYSPNVSTFSFQVYLQNLSRLTLFDVILKVDGVEQIRYPRQLESNETLVVDSFATQAALSPGQVISLDVEATSTHPQSQGWVRGSIQQTLIRIKQG